MIVIILLQLLSVFHCFHHWLLIDTRIGSLTISRYDQRNYPARVVIVRRCNVELGACVVLNASFGVFLRFFLCSMALTCCNISLVDFATYQIHRPFSDKTLPTPPAHFPPATCLTVG